MHYKSEVKGKGGIVARVVAKSVSATSGTEIITWELEYPRIVHSELMTHRVFSRNSASSRAIPVLKVIEQVRYNPAKPVHWGKNQAGMQANEELDSVHKQAVESLWEVAAEHSCYIARAMEQHGAHKQVVNRILEPFQFMKVVLTTTEKNNFYWLRDHKDADPTIHELARCMREADDNSTAVVLNAGDWHTPYYGDGFWNPWCDDTVYNALMISSSCAAQVSYRKLDDSLEKAGTVYKRLVESEPVHASPFEHQATPIEYTGGDTNNPFHWPVGVTHMSKDGSLWSGNFKDWLQHRQMIPNNNKN